MSNNYRTNGSSHRYMPKGSLSTHVLLGMPLFSQSWLGTEAWLGVQSKARLCYPCSVFDSWALPVCIYNE